MIPCPICRSPARGGRCPFCGALAATALLVAAQGANAQEVQALYGIPAVEELPLEPAAPRTGAELEMAANMGALTPEELAALVAADDLASVRLRVAHHRTRGEDPELAAALERLTELDRADADAPFMLVMLAAQHDQDARVVKWAGLAIDRSGAWPAEQRSRHLLMLHQLAARSAKKLGQVEAAQSHAKAFVGIATKIGSRVPDDMKDLSLGK
ncbi:MAG: hypothetical protein H6737_15255 [Alphaproteobacteria bacterium]|nr:hypothetical protein [Alphaproteobacteria bacterium]